MRGSLTTRFWPKVHKTDYCWLWTASVTGSGYGQIGLGARTAGRGDAHRVSWELHNGPVPTDKWVLHRCDNKRCVNPDHLYLGNNSLNAKDALARGQKKTGADCSFAKLSRDDVKEIKHLRLWGMSQQKIADRFNVAQATISRVLNEVSHRDH